MLKKDIELGSTLYWNTLEQTIQKYRLNVK